jgi:hypothetical protein
MATLPPAFNGASVGPLLPPQPAINSAALHAASVFR